MSSTLKTSYEEIVNPATFGSLTEMTNLTKMVDLARHESLRPSAEDSERVLLINIDNQKDFMDGGSLGVPGAAKDVERLCQWIYRNMGGISTIISSLDTHQPFQVFFKACWADENGNPPDDYTLITAPLASGMSVVSIPTMSASILTIWNRMARKPSASGLSTVSLELRGQQWKAIW